MSKRSRPRRPVKAARKVKRAVRAPKRRPGRAKPPKRSPRIGAPATLVSTEWLAAQLARPQSGGSRVRVLDGTWHMPHLERDPRREFEEAHIPGAAFFDVDAIADRTTSLPHMLPSAAQFARQVGELGISNRDLVVVYDVRGVVSAARVWWTFRAMGHDRVAVLDGGLRKWTAEGRPVETGPPRSPRRASAPTFVAPSCVTWNRCGAISAHAGSRCWTRVRAAASPAPSPSRAPVCAGAHSGQSESSL